MAEQVDRFAAYEIHEYRRRLLSRRVTEAFERALRIQSLSRSGLRAVIFEVIDHAVASGESPERGAEVLLAFLAEHPRRDELDRVSLIDGRRASDRVLDQVRSWIDVRLRAHTAGVP
jgi:hypothetical protein